MTQAAVHDAINGIRPRFELYTPGLPSSWGASVAAAVASAAANVLLMLVPSQVQSSTSGSAMCSPQSRGWPARNAGIALGTEVAQAILQCSSG